MSIHQTIKREREARQWSMEELARQVSEAEGLAKPLSWQTVQQWEKAGGTAPKRARLEVVAKLFDMTVAQLLGESPEPPSAAPAGAVRYNTAKVREVPVVGKGSGGVMPERIWTDGDYPVGKTGECADLATNDPEAFLVAVTNTSMVHRYNPGEFALVEPGTEPEIEDDVLVRLSTGETMLKRLTSRRGGWTFSSYNDPEVLFFKPEEVTWVYYVAHPVPRRKIKSRC